MTCTRLDVLVIAPDRQRLRVGERQLEFAGQFVHAHGRILGYWLLAAGQTAGG